MKTTTALFLAAMLTAGAASAQTSTPMPQTGDQQKTTDEIDGMANANPSSKDMNKTTSKQAKKQAKSHKETNSTSQGTSGTRGNTNADIDRRGGDADTGAVRPTDAAPSNAAPNSTTPTAPTR